MTTLTQLRAVVRDERGIALVMALIVLVALTGLLLAFLTLGSVEPTIAANLSQTLQARYVAEAGIELGYDLLADTTNWNTLLAGAPACHPVTGWRDVTTPNHVNQPVPGLTNAFGTYRLRVRNDCHAQDSLLTGAAVDTGNQTTDSNSRLILRAEATVGTARRVIEAVVHRNALPPTNAALSFPGQEADVAFNGDSFTVSGIDRNIDGSAGPQPAVYGIAVSATYPNPGTPSSPGPPGSNEARVENRLSSSSPNQKNNVSGKNETNPSATTTGNNTIQADSTLTRSAIQEFVDAAKMSADITIESTPTSCGTSNSTAGLQPVNPNASCTFNNISWGTEANPKIVYIKGSPPDPTSMFNAFNVTGNSVGYGILIVENGDFTMRDNFTWNGPVIVTGLYVGAGLMGSGNQRINGTLIVNEESTDEAVGFNEGWVAGNGVIQYSSQAMNLLNNTRKLVRLYGWREDAP
jgi:hypothetical protein